MNDIIRAIAMLIFFIHGVAERSADYAESLQSLIKQELQRRNQPQPVE
ncbi:MAG: hypothetical protein ACP5D7_11415 [Limnospira sp.]